MELDHNALVRQVYKTFMEEAEENNITGFDLEEERLDELAELVALICDRCKQSYEVLIVMNCLQAVLEAYFSYVESLSDEDMHRVIALAKTLQEINDLDTTDPNS